VEVQVLSWAPSLKLLFFIDNNRIRKRRNL